MPSRINKVLVVSCTAIGDTLFATPGIRAVKKLLPDAEIHLLVKEKFKALFATNPWIDSISGYKGGYKGGLGLLKEIKGKQYDLCVIFHDSDPCPAQMAFIAGIPFIFRIGQRDEASAPYLSGRIPYDQEKHAIDQRLEVIRHLFSVPLDRETDFRMDLPVDHRRSKSLWEEIHSTAGCQLERPRRIGFQFSASGNYKMWPLANFEQLGQRLLEKDKDTVICLIGGAGDKKAARKLAEKIVYNTGSFKGRVLNLAGSIRISDLPEIVLGLDLLVTNDTGPLHVAIAVGTPTVSLFVPSNFQATGPVQDLDIHKVISKPKPCKPCVEKYCSNPDCMALIKVDEVMEASLKILNRLDPASNSMKTHRRQIH